MPHQDRSAGQSSDDDVPLFIPATKSSQLATNSKTGPNSPFDLIRNGSSARSQKNQRADGVHRSRGALIGLILIRTVLILMPLSIIGLVAVIIWVLLGSHPRTTAAGPTVSPNTAAGAAPTAAAPPAVLASVLAARLDRSGSVLALTQTLTLAAPVSALELSAPDTALLKGTLRWSRWIMGHRHVCIVMTTGG